MPFWMSIEVLDGAFPASRWQDAHSDGLVESAVGHGAVGWEWHVQPWGVVFEIAFADEGAWEVFRGLPSVRAALDAVPDPVNGLLVYRGRGGGAGAPAPRGPRPRAGSDAAALPEPVEEVLLDLTAVHEPAPPVEVAR